MLNYVPEDCRDKYPISFDPIERMFYCKGVSFTTWEAAYAELIKS